MEQQELTTLANQYSAALLEEYTAKLKATNAAAETDRVAAEIIAVGYAEGGAINGKNADTRKAQERALLAESIDYKLAQGAQAQADNEAALLEIERKRVEALVSLTKAWLYSQSGR